MKVEELILMALCILLGEQGKDWEYYETSEEWWAIRLWTRRNYVTMVTESACKNCPFYESSNKCLLPVGQPTKSIKSPREHYRSYFKRPCYRKPI